MRPTRVLTAVLMIVSWFTILLLSADARAQTGQVGFGVSPNVFRASQSATIRLYVSSSSVSSPTLSPGDTFNFFLEPSIGSVSAVVGPVSADSTTLSAGDFSASLAPSQNQAVITYNSQPKLFSYGSIISVEISFTASGQIGSGKISFSSRFTASVNGNLPYTTVSIVDFGGTIAHDATLTGDGSSSSPLGIAPGGVNTPQLANGAVIGAKIANGAVGTAQLADASVIEAKIAPGAVGQAELANGSVTSLKIANGAVVRSLNGITEGVTLAAGSNVTISPSGNTLTIAASSGSGVAYVARNDVATQIDTPTVILSKDVPAGSFLLLFSVLGTNGDSDKQTIDCTVLSNGSPIAEGRLTLNAFNATVNEEGTLSFPDAETFNTPTTLKVSCVGFQITASNSILIAHRIDSIQ